MFKLFKSKDKEEVIKKNDTKTKNERTTLEAEDYYITLLNLHELKLKEVDNSMLGNDIEELNVALTLVSKHKNELIQQFDISLKGSIHLESYRYSLAVIRLLTEVTKDVPNYVVNYALKETDTQDIKRLVAYLTEYFSLMGVLHDHVQDIHIDHELKTNIDNYYSRYVSTVFSV